MCSFKSSSRHHLCCPCSWPNSSTACKHSRVSGLSPSPAGRKACEMVRNMGWSPAASVQRLLSFCTSASSWTTWSLVSSLWNRENKSTYCIGFLRGWNKVQSIVLRTKWALRDVSRYHCMPYHKAGLFSYVVLCYCISWAHGAMLVCRLFYLNFPQYWDILSALLYKKGKWHSERFGVLLEVTQQMHVRIKTGIWDFRFKNTLFYGLGARMSNQRSIHFSRPNSNVPSSMKSS